MIEINKLTLSSKLQLKDDLIVGNMVVRKETEIKILSIDSMNRNVGLQIGPHYSSFSFDELNRYFDSTPGVEEYAMKYLAGFVPVRTDVIGKTTNVLLKNGTISNVTCREEDIFNKGLGEKIAIVKAQKSSIRHLIEMMQESASYELMNSLQYLKRYLDDRYNELINMISPNNFYPGFIIISEEDNKDGKN